MENLTKSDAGWRRFRERTDGGARARRCRMDHRVRKAAKPRVDLPLVEQLEPELHEVESVSWCADCDGPCACE